MDQYNFQSSLWFRSNDRDAFVSNTNSMIKSFISAKNKSIVDPK